MVAETKWWLPVPLRGGTSCSEGLLGKLEGVAGPGGRERAEDWEGPSRQTTSLPCMPWQGGQCWELQGVSPSALGLRAGWVHVPQQKELCLFLPGVLQQRSGTPSEHVFCKSKETLLAAVAKLASLSTHSLYSCQHLGEEHQEGRARSGTGCHGTLPLRSH